MEQRIGVVGLGRMGANMARRMKDCGHRVAVVHDREVGRASELAGELGCEAAASLAAVSRGAEVIFTVVSDDAAMEAIFAADGLLQGAAGRTFINCATLRPETHQRVARRCAEAGAQALEACMASSIPQARDGSLYLMVAGDEAVFAAVRPLLDDLSASLRFLGPAGRAAEVKALVNMVMNMNTAALAEGLGLGQALGLDLEVLCEVFAQTGANSRVLETDGPDMLARDHDCYFSAEHAAKDSGIANALAAAAGVEAPLSEATEAQFRRLIAAGKGQLDKSAVAELTFPGRHDESTPA